MWAVKGCAAHYQRIVRAACEQAQRGRGTIAVNDAWKRSLTSHAAATNTFIQKVRFLKRGKGVNAATLTLGLRSGVD